MFFFFFEFWISKRSRKEMSIGTLVFSRSWNVNLKDSGILMEMSCMSISKTADIHSSELSVRWIGDSWKRNMDEVRFTSVRFLRMQSFYFARSILQISSVCTEQSRIGVMKWLSRFLVNHLQSCRNPLRKWMSSYIENWILRRWIRWNKHGRRMFKQRDIDCVIFKINSKIYQKFVNRLDSWGKSLLDNTSESCTTWMMVSEEDRLMQRVFVGSWWARFRIYCMDRWTHQNWSSSPS